MDGLIGATSCVLHTAALPDRKAGSRIGSGALEHTMRLVVSAMLILAALIALIPQPVRAQGACQRLWVARNSIYKDNGYCFNTPRGVRYFGNAGCQYDDVRQVPLSRGERARVAEILAEEQALGCR
jgi:hypothetical protein